MAQNNIGGAGNGCPHYKKCGGCQLQNMDYAEQLGFKERKVIGLLGRFGKVNDIIPMENPEHYRHKVQIAYGQLKTKAFISGVWQSSSHLVMPMDSCMLDDAVCDKIAVTIRKLLLTFRLSVYNDYRHNGLLRFVMLRKGYYSGEILVALAVGDGPFPRKNDFIKALLKAHPEITTIVKLISIDEKNLILGHREEILYGNGYIEDELCGYTFRISSKSFFQVNPVQTQILYNTAMSFAGLTGQETVIDAYCGVGTIGIVASAKAKRVWAVETNKESVKNARFNIKRNEIKNIEVFNVDAGDFICDMVENKVAADLVFMDPPRAGASKEFIDALVKLLPKKIVYISCNPETQARDLLPLVNAGYRARAIQPVDLFPHTGHVEVIVQLDLTK